MVFNCESSQTQTKNDALWIIVIQDVHHYNCTTYMYLSLVVDCEYSVDKWAKKLYDKIKKNKCQKLQNRILKNI